MSLQGCDIPCRDVHTLDSQETFNKEQLYKFIYRAAMGMICATLEGSRAYECELITPCSTVDIVGSDRNSICSLQ